MKLLIKYPQSHGTLKSNVCMTSLALIMKHLNSQASFNNGLHDACTVFVPCRSTKKDITSMLLIQAQVNNLRVNLLLLIEYHLAKGRKRVLTVTASISVEQTLSTRLHTLAMVQKEGDGAWSTVGRWGPGTGRTRAVTHWVTWQHRNRPKCYMMVCTYIVLF